MLKRILGYLLGIAANEALDATIYSGETAEDATVLRVIDGDTVRFAEWQKPCRLDRIDAAEMDGPNRSEALRARSALHDKLDAADRIHVEQVGRGHYGRPVVEIWTASEGEWTNVNSWLREIGLAEAA